MDEYSTIAHVIFGGEVRKRKDRYYMLQKQLRQAHMAQSYEVYVSVAYLTSIIIGIIGGLLGLLLGFLLGGAIIKGTNLGNIHSPIGGIPGIVSQILIVFIAMVILGAIGYIVTFTTFLLIPSFNASERKSKINKGLPSAVTFMYAMSKGGTDIISIIRALHEAESTYGEVSKEMGFIIRDMDYFGNDLRVAILNCVAQTPSDLLQDLLSNLLSVIDSGGDVTTYLTNKVEQYRMRIQQDQKSFLEILGLIAESYVTMFVAGPLFIIIMTSVMTIMNGGSPMILYILVYAVLPIGSVMFTILISMLTPQEEDRTSLFDVQVSNQYDTVPLLGAADASPADKKRSADLKKARENLKTKEFLANPLAGIRKDPTKVLYISIPAALVMIILLMFVVWPVLGFGSMGGAMQQVSDFQKDMRMGKQKVTTDILVIYGPIFSFLDDFIVFFFVLAIAPLAFFHEAKARRERKIAAEMPDFLKKLSSTNETGMTLTQSINLISNSNFGLLSTEVQKVHKDLSWGTDVSTALKRFANELRTNASTKVITLITKAAASSGDIKDVLNIAANDSRINEQMRRERFDGMLIYVIIIFISFVVFIYCVYTLTSSFIPVMATAATTSTGQGSSSSVNTQGATFIQSFNPDDYVRLFFHAALIQGLCAGILAGQMGEGHWMSGLKYSLIMVLIAYVLFTLLI